MKSLRTLEIVPHTTRMSLVFHKLAKAAASSAMDAIPVSKETSEGLPGPLLHRLPSFNHVYL